MLGSDVLLKYKCSVDVRLQILILSCNLFGLHWGSHPERFFRSSLLQMRWTLLPLPWMNHSRYVYYRKQGYRRISPSAICFVSAFIKHSVHFSRPSLDYLFTAVFRLKCNKYLACCFVICWKSYCLRCYVLDLRQKRGVGVTTNAAVLAVCWTIVPEVSSVVFVRIVLWCSTTEAQTWYILRL